MREGVLRVMGVFNECLGMWRSVRRLNRRITCPVHVLLTFRMIPHGGLNLYRVGERREFDLLEQSSEAMGNPLVGMSRLAPGSRPRATRNPGYRPQSFARHHPGTDGTRLDDQTAWRERFLQALGAMDAEELELVERIARTAWERLELFRVRAEKEERELERILSAPAPSEVAMGLVASEIARLFESEVTLFDEAMRLEKELKGMLELLLARRSQKPNSVRRAEAGGEDSRGAAADGLGAVA